MPLPTPKIDPMGLNDPLDETFWKETWVAVAVHNVSYTLSYPPPKSLSHALADSS